MTMQAQGSASFALPRALATQRAPLCRDARLALVRRSLQCPGQGAWRGNGDHWGTNSSSAIGLYGGLNRSLSMQNRLPRNSAPSAGFQATLVPCPSICSPCPPNKRSLSPAAQSAEEPTGSSSSVPAPHTYKKGDAVLVVEDPPFVKTAEPMPMMRRNSGQVQKGDVGRILDCRPKDVWAVRLGTGAFLLDGKYLEPLE